jgi:hypothetical protein
VAHYLQQQACQQDRRLPFNSACASGEPKSIKQDTELWCGYQLRCGHEETEHLQARTCPNAAASHTSLQGHRFTVHLACQSPSQYVHRMNHRQLVLAYRDLSLRPLLEPVDEGSTSCTDLILQCSHK